MEKRRGRALLGTAYAVMAAFYLYIAFRVPYCHDDWDWGLDVGLRQWLEASLNSRYAGSFFAVAMTRSEIFKTLVIAITLFSIPLLLTKLSGQSVKPGRYFFANLLMLTIPQLMWQQTHGWVSGFANYVVSAALTLFLILMMEKSRTRIRSRYYLLLPLAAAQALFIENLAVYSTAALAIFTLARIVKTRKVCFFHILMTLSSLAGTVIMFSSQVYCALKLDGTALGGIRDLSFDINAGTGNIAGQLSARFVFGFFTPFFYDYRALMSVLVLALIGGGAVRRHKVKIPALAAACYIFAGIFCAYAFLKKGESEIDAVLAALFFASVAVIIGSVFEEKWKMLFLWLSAPAVLLPLAVCGDNGPRLFYISYVFAASVAVLALPKLSAVPRRVCGALAALCLLGVMAFYVRVYSGIYSVTIARREAVEYAVGNGLDTIYMEKDVYKYWWGRNPQSEGRIVFFKEFYGIPSEINVIFEK